MVSDWIIEDLTKEAMHALARNKEDIRNAETDEERAFNFMRAWVESEVKRVFEVQLELDRLRAEKEELEDGQERLEELLHQSEKNCQAMKEYQGSLDDDDDAPENDVHADDIDYNSADEEELSAMERAEKKHRMIEMKIDSMQARLSTIDKEIAWARSNLVTAEEEQEEAWQASKGELGDGRQSGSIRVQLSTEHVRRYFVHLAKYPEYYRELPEARSTWIASNVMNIWGGVSILFALTDDISEIIC